MVNKSMELARKLASEFNISLGNYKGLDSLCRSMGLVVPDKCDSATLLLKADLAAGKALGSKGEFTIQEQKERSCFIGEILLPENEIRKLIESVGCTEAFERLVICGLSPSFVHSELQRRGFDTFALVY